MNLKRIYIGIIAISIIFSFFFLKDRIEIENNMKHYNFVLDLEEIVKLANDSGKSTEYWLSFFENQGVGYAALTEETIYSLKEAGKNFEARLASYYIKNPKEFLTLPEAIQKDINEKKIDQFDLILNFYDNQFYEYFRNGIVSRYEKSFFNIYEEENSRYIVLEGRYQDMIFSSEVRYVDVTGEGLYTRNEPVSSILFNIGIDYDMEKFKMIQDAGLSVVLRPINHVDYSQRIAENFINQLATINPEQKFILFSGKSIAGYPAGTQALLEYMKEHEISPVMIENGEQRGHIVQNGLSALTQNLNYAAIRAFTMWDFVRERVQQYNYTGAEEIENTLYRAITERNIRIIYFKPFLDGDYKYFTDEQEYEKTFHNLENRLAQHGIALGDPSPVSYTRVSRTKTFLMSLSVILLAIYLLRKLIKLDDLWIHIFTAIGVLMSAGIIFVAPDLAKKAFAFAAAVVFSSWAAYYFISMSTRIIGGNLNISKLLRMALSLVITSFAISLIGAYVSTAFLSESKYLLEMDIFRGVKLSQVVPIVFTVMIYLAFVYKKNEDTFVSIFKKMLMTNIRVFYVLIFAIIAYIGYIYISRTGHDSAVQPLEIEMILRNFFERNMLARPRTKEFLIAFPSMFLYLYTINKGYRFVPIVFAIGSAIGFASIINTFSHIRTPLYLSTIRSGYSLFLGLILGIIALLVADITLKLISKYMRRHHA